MLFRSVLTFAATPYILASGAKAYADYGMGRSRGTQPFQLAGNIRRGGLVELAFGCTIRDLIEGFGGSTLTGKPVRAVQVGGPLGAYFPDALLDTKLDYEEMLGKKGMKLETPLFVRVFKEESELEVWKQRDDGRFYHFKTYPICNWSGTLGPKIQQGDMQAPEGFYSVPQSQMNPNSQYHLAFNLGYPNSYDRANRRTGEFLMIHGKCKSAGCYAMTDALIPVPAAPPGHDYRHISVTPWSSVGGAVISGVDLRRDLEARAVIVEVFGVVEIELVLRARDDFTGKGDEGAPPFFLERGALDFAGVHALLHEHFHVV